MKHMNVLFVGMMTLCQNVYPFDGDLNSTLAKNVAPCSLITLTCAQTITESGSYCLANDINGSLIIAADNVSLDLNSHAITQGGIIAQATFGSIIKNGAIKNSTVGIVLNNTTDACVENIAITQSVSIAGITSSGKKNRLKNIYIDTVATGLISSDVNLSIDTLTIINTTGGAMKCTDLHNSIFKNIIIEKTGFNGIECDGSCTYNTFEDIAITLCAGTGFYFNAGSNQHVGCELSNISVNTILAPGVAGIYATNCAAFRLVECAVRDCQGNNFSCFKIDAGTNNIFENCLAISNAANALCYGYQLGCNQSYMNNCVVSGLASTTNVATGFLSSGSNNELRNCLAQNITIAPTSPNSGSAIGFNINGIQNILFDCQASNIIQQGNSTGNNAFGYFIEAHAISLNNCFADECNASASNTSVGIMVGGSALNILLVNCNAINSNGYGFQMQSKTSLIGCNAHNNATGFYAFNGPGYSFRDCTATFNNTGFNGAGAVNLVAINCYASNNATNFTWFPNTQAVGSAAPATGVNIYK